MSRDSQTDAGRMGAPSQTKANMAMDAKDFGAITLAQMQQDGMQPGAKPEGGAEPPDMATELDTH